MYGCESWIIKKAQCQRTDAFKLWRWRRLLRAPWTARKSNQSVLKVINHECSLEGLMLKCQYFGHLMRRADSVEKDPDAGKDWRQKEKREAEDEMVGGHHWFNGHEFEQTLGDCEGQGSLLCCSPWGVKESDTTERLNNNKTEWNFRSESGAAGTGHAWISPTVGASRRKSKSALLLPNWHPHTIP